MIITATYEDWNSLPRGGGRAMCEAPSIATINNKLDAPLKWDAAAKGWSGDTAQVEALADRLQEVGERYLAIYGAASGITARLTREQAAKMLRVAEAVRVQIAA